MVFKEVPVVEEGQIKKLFSVKMIKSNIQDIVKDLGLGKVVIIVDDEDRENEGDLVCAAELVTADIVNFMAKYGRGLICLTLTKEKCRELDLKQMTSSNESSNKTAFTVSIEAKDGITTGISAQDRATTILAAVHPEATADDIAQPGHVFPLEAMDGGVLARAGHTEASCDLAKLSGLSPSGVICEIMNDDGSMARRDDLEMFAKKHDLKIGTIADLIDFRLSQETTIKEIEKRKVDTDFGEFELHIWEDILDQNYHFSLSKGLNKGVENPLVRVQTQSVLQDTLGIKELGKKWSVRQSLKKIAQEDAGVLVLINHRDASSYWLSLLKGKELTKKSRRVIGAGSQILRALGLKKIRVLGTPTKYNNLSGFNIEITSFENER